MQYKEMSVQDAVIHTSLAEKHLRFVSAPNRGRVSLATRQIRKAICPFHDLTGISSYTASEYSRDCFHFHIWQYIHQEW